MLLCADITVMSTSKFVHRAPLINSVWVQEELPHHIWGEIYSKTFLVALLIVYLHQGGFVFTPSAGLLVCYKIYTKTTQRISTKLGWRTTLSPEETRLTLDADPRFFSHLLQHYKTGCFTSFLLTWVQFDPRSGECQSSLLHFKSLY